MKVSNRCTKYIFYYITSTLHVSGSHWPIIRGVMAASLCYHLVHAVMWYVRAVAGSGLVVLPLVYGWRVVVAVLLVVVGPAIRTTTNSTAITTLQP
jgi:hypothetical protein